MPYDSTLLYVLGGVICLIMIVSFVWSNTMLKDKNKEIADLRLFATQLQNDLMDLNAQKAKHSLTFKKKLQPLHPCQEMHFPHWFNSGNDRSRRLNYITYFIEVYDFYCVSMNIFGHQRYIRYKGIATIKLQI